MANEIFKELKTKIALKTLTFAEWEAIKDTYKPLRGEVCICEIPEGNAAATNAPTVLFKVGDGTNYFSGLKWASALAADVHAWAKENELKFSKSGTGNVVSGMEWDATLNGGKGGIKFTTASVATSEGLAQLQKDVDAVEKDIADNRDLWAKDTTYTFEKTADGKGFTVTPSDGNGKTISFAFLTQSEIEALNYLVKADITTGSADGTIAVEGTDVKVKGLESAAYVTVDSLNATAKGYADAVEAKLPTSADYGVLSVAKGDDTITIGGTAQNPTVKVTANTFDAYGAAAEVKTGVEDGTIKAKTAEHADAAGKVDAALTVKIGGADVVFDGSAAKTADVDSAIAAAEKRAKDYADAKPHENTAHSHSAGSGTKVSANGGIDGDVKVNLNVAFELVDKTIKLYDKDDTSKTAIATLDATEFIADGMLQSVTADEAKNELVFTWNTDAGVTTTTIPFDKIADIYTGAANSEISVAVSNTNEISATLVNKGVTEEKLEQDVQDALALARTALQSHQDISGKKDKQTAVADHNLSGATVVKGIAQNENGVITVSTRTLTPADIGAVKSGDEIYTAGNNIDITNRTVALKDELVGVKSIKNSLGIAGIGIGEDGRVSIEEAYSFNVYADSSYFNCGVQVNGKVTATEIETEDLAVTGDVTVGGKALSEVIKTTLVDEAGKATNDGNGKNIANTYATKAEATYTAGSNIDITGNKVSVNSELDNMTGIHYGDERNIGIGFTTDGIVETKGRVANFYTADGVSIANGLVVGSGNLAISNGELTVNNKTLATHIAEGVKANALYEVEVGTGLKVSDKANNKQTISIDETVVFVLNCNF